MIKEPIQVERLTTANTINNLPENIVVKEDKYYLKQDDGYEKELIQERKILSYFSKK